jgi:hypothetical protein
MPLPHFLQIGGVAFTVLAVFANRSGVSPETSNADAAADMAKPRYLGNQNVLKLMDATLL